MIILGREIKILFRYDGYRGDGYYWKFGDGNWHGPYDSEIVAEAVAQGFWK